MNPRGKIAIRNYDNNNCQTKTDSEGREITMALMLGKLYEALLKPGDATLAGEAAEEVAAYENRLSSIEARLASLERSVTMLTALTLLNLSLVIGLYFKP
jgi:hypothetical protein